MTHQHFVEQVRNVNRLEHARSPWNEIEQVTRGYHDRMDDPATWRPAPPSLRPEPSREAKVVLPAVWFEAF